MAMGGLVYLLAPGATAPSPFGAALMILSGVGWGVYSLLGKGKGDPTARTAGNFTRAAILLAILTPVMIFTLPEARPGISGGVLAILSGTVTSGLGYTLWYSVLRHITVTTAAISQLSVPVIAAIGGAIFVLEPVTFSFGLTCAIVLIGVGVATITPVSKTSSQRSD